MERRKFIIGAGALATGSAAAVGSGAFSAAVVEGREADIEVSGDDSALLALVKGHDDRFSGRSVSSTVSDNRVRQEDGELLIDFTDDQGGEGINYNSTYQVGAVGWNDASFSDAEEDLSVSADDVIYGDTADPDDPTIQEDPAFVVMNQSDQEVEIEMGWDESKSPSNGSAALLAEPGAPGSPNDTDSGSSQGEIELSAPIAPGEGLLTATIPSGGAISLSLIAVMGAPETTDDGDTSNDNWEGTLDLKAEHATEY